MSLLDRVPMFDEEAILRLKLKEKDAEIKKLRALCGRAKELDSEAYGCGICWDIDDHDDRLRYALLEQFERASKGETV